MKIVLVYWKCRKPSTNIFNLCAPRRKHWRKYCFCQKLTRLSFAKGCWHQSGLNMLQLRLIKWSIRRVTVRVADRNLRKNPGMWEDIFFWFVSCTWNAWRGANHYHWVTSLRYFHSEAIGRGSDSFQARRLAFGSLHFSLY